MFDSKFLDAIRECELEVVLPYLRSGARVLEFGAGNGSQAKQLEAMGFEVIAIDLPDSQYAKSRVFPVLEYDGLDIPLPDSSVDIIFSSNVMEHVKELPKILSEFHRVLNKDGFCIHLMPSVQWRVWTFLTGIPTAFISAIRLLRHLALSPIYSLDNEAVFKDLKIIVSCILPLGHGISLEGISEIWTFSIKYWLKQFERHGFEALTYCPCGLFYTGHMLFGFNFPLSFRRSVSKYLGSGSNVFLCRSFYSSPKE
jgi:SAM-dependent methyltransferase